MVGTSDEMLLYFSYMKSEFSVITSSPTIIVRIRDNIKRGRISEEQKAEWLTLLGCKQIRPRLKFPAIICDRHKRMFDEVSFIKYYMNEKDRADIERKIGACKIYNGTITQRAMKILLKHKKAYIAVERIELPSLWSYEPVLDVLPNDVTSVITKMIGNHFHR